jgi:hypothetical protein
MASNLDPGSPLADFDEPIGQGGIGSDYVANQSKISPSGQGGIGSDYVANRRSSDPSKFFVDNPPPRKQPPPPPPSGRMDDGGIPGRPLQGASPLGGADDTPTYYAGRTRTPVYAGIPGTGGKMQPSARVANSPAHQWYTFATIYGMLGSKFTQKPLTDSTSAAAKALTSYHSGDREAGDRAFDEWQTSMTSTQEAHNYQTANYDQILGPYRHVQQHKNGTQTTTLTIPDADLPKVQAQMHAAMTAFGDTAGQTAWRASPDGLAFADLMNKRDHNMTQLADKAAKVQKAVEEAQMRLAEQQLVRQPGFTDQPVIDQLKQLARVNPEKYEAGLREESDKIQGRQEQGRKDEAAAAKEAARQAEIDRRDAERRKEDDRRFDESERRLDEQSKRDASLEEHRLKQEAEQAKRDAETAKRNDASAVEQARRDDARDKAFAALEEHRLKQETEQLKRDDERQKVDSQRDTRSQERLDEQGKRDAERQKVDDQRYSESQRRTGEQSRRDDERAKVDQEIETHRMALEDAQARRDALAQRRQEFSEADRKVQRSEQAARDSETAKRDTANQDRANRREEFSEADRKVQRAEQARRDSETARRDAANQDRQSVLDKTALDKDARDTAKANSAEEEKKKQEERDQKVADIISDPDFAKKPLVDQYRDLMAADPKRYSNAYRIAAAQAPKAETMEAENRVKASAVYKNLLQTDPVGAVRLMASVNPDKYLPQLAATQARKMASDAKAQDKSVAKKEDSAIRVAALQETIGNALDVVDRMPDSALGQVGLDIIEKGEGLIGADRGRIVDQYKTYINSITTMMSTELAGSGRGTQNKEYREALEELLPRINVDESATTERIALRTLANVLNRVHGEPDKYDDVAESTPKVPPWQDTTPQPQETKPQDISLPGPAGSKTSTVNGWNAVPDDGGHRVMNSGREMRYVPGKGWVFEDGSTVGK